MVNCSWYIGKNKSNRMNFELPPGTIMKENNKSSLYIISLDVNPANIYLFKVNNRNTRKMCEICSKLPIKITLWPTFAMVIHCRFYSKQKHFIESLHLKQENAWKTLWSFYHYELTAPQHSNGQYQRKFLTTIYVLARFWCF